MVEPFWESRVSTSGYRVRAFIGSGPLGPITAVLNRETYLYPGAGGDGGGKHCRRELVVSEVAVFPPMSTHEVVRFIGHWLAFYDEALPALTSDLALALATKVPVAEPPAASSGGQLAN